GPHDARVVELAAIGRTHAVAQIRLRDANARAQVGVRRGAEVVAEERDSIVAPGGAVFGEARVAKILRGAILGTSCACGGSLPVSERANLGPFVKWRSRREGGEELLVHDSRDVERLV